MSWPPQPPAASHPQSAGPSYPQPAGPSYPQPRRPAPVPRPKAPRGSFFGAWLLIMGVFGVVMAVVLAFMAIEPYRTLHQGAAGVFTPERQSCHTVRHDDYCSWHGTFVADGGSPVQAHLDRDLDVLRGGTPPGPVDVLMAPDSAEVYLADDPGMWRRLATGSVTMFVIGVIFIVVGTMIRRRIARAGSDTAPMGGPGLSPGPQRPQAYGPPGYGPSGYGPPGYGPEAQRPSGYSPPGYGPQSYPPAGDMPRAQGYEPPQGYPSPRDYPG